jgi:hypothetical protein
LAEYRAGRFVVAHDYWEEVWRESEGDERCWVQGLIMLAAAAIHSGRGRLRPARRLLVRASDLMKGRDPVAGLAIPPDVADRALAAAELPHPANPPVSLG